LLRSVADRGASRGSLSVAVIDLLQSSLH
jgi:hypothetical protein